MGVSRYRYLHYDVFTHLRFAGNQLAVFPEAAGLTASSMQQIAREIGFAETTFVTPAEGPGTDVRMRIFTPGIEMPMAGHPTIGSTFVLAREGRIAAGRKDWVFGLNIGPVPVALEWGETGLDFAWMTQGTPEFGLRFDQDDVANRLGLDAEDIRATGLPVECVSCGVPYVIVPLTTRVAVDRAVPAALDDFAVYLYTRDRGGATDPATTYTRMFAPDIGVIEDAATGSAAGPLGAYLVRHAMVEPDSAGRILNLQGVRMGRPSWIHIAVDSSGGRISRVRVGGTSVFVAEGVMEVGE